MENTKKIWALVLLAFATVLVISSCQKKQCYHCYSFEGSFWALKNGDSTFVGTQSTFIYYDSINYYISKGYGIKNGEYGFAAAPASGAVSCHTNFDYRLLRFVIIFIELFNMK